MSGTVALLRPYVPSWRGQGKCIFLVFETNTIITGTVSRMYVNEKRTLWNFSFQRMHYLLKHKILRFVFKCYFSSPYVFRSLRTIFRERTSEPCYSY
jgi:hypothetical protein